MPPTRGHHPTWQPLAVCSYHIEIQINLNQIKFKIQFSRHTSRASKSSSTVRLVAPVPDGADLELPSRWEVSPATLPQSGR